MHNPDFACKEKERIVNLFVMIIMIELSTETGILLKYTLKHTPF